MPSITEAVVAEQECNDDESDDDEQQ